MVSERPAAQNEGKRRGGDTDASGVFSLCTELKANCVPINHSMDV